MRDRWLNFVLHLTNRIYARKQSVLAHEGLKSAGDIAALVLLESVLALVSFPLYVGLKPATVTAFLQEKGGYAKIAFDYHLRRILTLTGVSIVLVIWLLKLALIIFVPAFYGPLRLYSVSEISPVPLQNKELIAADTQIQTARIIETMPKPRLVEVRKEKGGDYVFFGTGKSGTEIVLLLSGQQSAVYTESVDKSGHFAIRHSQKNFKLNEGNHSVIVFSYDKDIKARSNIASEQFFKVTSTFTDRLIKNIDILANWSVIIILAIGIFLTALTL